MYLYDYGDLILSADNDRFDVIAHGCNCFCTMGAGIARLIRARWPEAYEADLSTRSSDQAKLGKFSMAKVKTKNGGNLIVVNAYTQYHFRGQHCADYTAIRGCMNEISNMFPGKKIGMPKIGAGLAGGKWDIIENIIKGVLVDEHVTVMHID